MANFLETRDNSDLFMNAVAPRTTKVDEIYCDEIDNDQLYAIFYLDLHLRRRRRRAFKLIVMTDAWRMDWNSLTLQNRESSERANGENKNFRISFFSTNFSWSKHQRYFYWRWNIAFESFWSTERKFNFMKIQFFIFIRNISFSSFLYDVEDLNASWEYFWDHLREWQINASDAFPRIQIV